jgi:hypothetical protein
LRLKESRPAANAFQDIVDRRGALPYSPLYGLAHLGLARAAALSNDSAAARKNYEAFFSIWKEADADVPALRQARSEYAQLR